MTTAQAATLAEIVTASLLAASPAPAEDGELYGVEIRPHRDGDYVQGPETIPAGSWRVETGAHYPDDGSDRTFVSIVAPDGTATSFEVQ